MAHRRHAGPWVDTERDTSIRRGGKSFEVHELTGKGRGIVDWVLGATDLRLETDRAGPRL